MVRRKKAKRYDYADDLLPCPFCGDKNLLWTGEKGGTYIDCWTCFARGPFILRGRPGKSGLPSGRFPAAKRVWNKRAAVGKEGNAAL